MAFFLSGSASLFAGVWGLDPQAMKRDREHTCTTREWVGVEGYDAIGKEFVRYERRERERNTIKVHANSTVIDLGCGCW